MPDMLGHNRKMSGAECLADMLKDYGVTHVFMVPAVLRRTFAEMERRNTGIARIHTHGEKSAAYMADGYARASGRPGVCSTTGVVSGCFLSVMAGPSTFTSHFGLAPYSSNVTDVSSVRLWMSR